MLSMGCSLNSRASFRTPRYLALFRLLAVVVFLFLGGLLLPSPLQAEDRVDSQGVSAKKPAAAPQIIDDLANAESVGLDRAIIGLYRSSEPLVRVLAYINTIRIPPNAVLEKKLRACLLQDSSKTEQYIILYVLASITRSESDIAALMEHVFKFPYVIRCALYASESIRVAEFSLTTLYPWMVHNNVYKRDAWLCGIICAEYVGNALTTEARSDYLASFPPSVIFPNPPAPAYKAESIYRQGGLSQPEITWLHNSDQVPYAEDEWLKSCEMPTLPEGLLSEAWIKTFDALLPLLDQGGKDAELARMLAAPALKWDNPGGKYNRLLSE